MTAPANHSATRIFAASGIISLAAIVVAYFYGGWKAAGLTLILGILEITLSFDNAVVNAKVLERMSERWQQIFLTVGIVIAVFGMRLVFPLLVVVLTAHMSPGNAITLAFQKLPISDHESYAYKLHEAHPQIAAFGGMFLLLLFLDWLFEEREITWLTWLERPLARIGKLDALSVIIAGVLLFVIGQTVAADPGKVLAAGVLGIVSYLAVNGLGGLFENFEESQEEEFERKAHGGPSEIAKAVGKAGFFLFLYLEVLDASFSFDGVIGAFAITPDPIIIALGLGLIGALFVRSLTVYLVRKGTLNDYVYLEHGAHWAIGALALILLITIKWEVNEVVTGLVGLVLIGAAFVSSLMRNRREAAEGEPVQEIDVRV
ncbi:hypothetical protein SAMN04515671_2091 [Nakamurella panacisegetis]|uniref:Integral membrane protein, YkoY family n=1 Tax=Nakamurella panacisegetis TaxID=1090615 RepID=A0A1H0MSM7_9ACTN|nr:DUF475 domain-containing protein [Nakamurella panacisegetis]SDO83423.1 hypothetical protein SAMN04515671_2091 [Nakamurella panacisegetis]